MQGHYVVKKCEGFPLCCQQCSSGIYYEKSMMQHMKQLLNVVFDGV
jgi:hypothetical protein